jgi:pimeloyl-ACP methyl ester carboxylesterase
MTAYQDKYFRSRDGLKLYYRVYAGDERKVPVLCLPGLTRTSRDFEALAQRIAPARSVITPDQRGRGCSQYDSNWLNYHPGTYVDDMWTLLTELRVPRAIVIGTSLGGVMAMLMAASRPQALAAVVLNDIGPQIDPVGERRIRGYVGRLPPVKTWNAAVDQLKANFGPAFPDYSEEQWLAFARTSFMEDEHGQPRIAADPKIGDAMRAVPAGVMPSFWLTYAALKDIPTLALRGELSDLLAVSTFERMQREKPDLQRVTVPQRGHPPQLDEPESLQAVLKFLDAIKQ